MVNYHLSRAASRATPVAVGLIGAGNFGMAIATQSAAISLLEVRVIADMQAETGRDAYRRAGIPDDRIVVCDARQAALHALEQGKRVIVEDAELMMDLPLDIVAEATGNAYAGARHALAAIRAGKHVAMVNKETDSVVGPMLHQLARKAGVVYTPVDGDQHGLLIGMADWARSLGLRILCAGKSRGVEFVYDRDTGTVNTAGPGARPRSHRVDEAQRKVMQRIPPGEAARFYTKRNEALSALPSREAFDLCEMVIAANALGLQPDVPELHVPTARTVEIADLLCPASSGGILTERENVIDLVTCLREEDEAGHGGGIFLVVACDDEYSRKFLIHKGCLANAAGDALLLYRPYHLCGVEVAASLLRAVLDGEGSCTNGYRQRYDMVKAPTRDMKRGETIGGDGGASSLYATLVPAVPLRDGSPIAAHLMTGCKLKCDVTAGTTITADMVELSADSALLQLRRQQDVQANDEE